MKLTAMIKNAVTSNPWKDYKSVFSTGQLNNLEAKGLLILEGKREGAYIYDDKGRRYLDCISGAGTHNLGRRPPELVRTLIEQINKSDQGNFVFISREKALLAEKLIEFVPADLQGCFFSVMRGEAMDFACKIARGYTGRSGFVTVDGGAYGQTGFALSLSDREDMSLYGTLIPDIKKIPFGNTNSIESAITKKTAAVFIEPIQAENSCRTAGAEYFRALRKACSKKGALLVIDETQTGMGRTGKKFAFESLGVAPDLLVIGEALGAGVFPIAATLFTKKVQRFMNDHPLIHLSTFGGHDLGCRVACRALELYNETAPWDNAEAMGRILISGLEKLHVTYPDKLRSVAGQGLLISLNTSSEDEALMMCRSLAKSGILAARGEVAKNSVVLRPPLIISDQEAETIIKGVERALK